MQLMKKKVNCFDMSIKYIIIIISFFIIFVSGCKTVEKIEYVDKYHTIHKSDTLIKYDKDSIFVNQFIKGDTVFKTKYVEKIKYIDKIVVKRDTLTLKETINVETVKNVIPSWCYKTIIALLVLVMILGFWIYINRK